MKKMPDTIDNIKKKIIELKGEEVHLYINRGRRKVSLIRARIENVYSSVFTVKTLSADFDVISTYSFNDVLCGEVKIKREKKNEKLL